MCVKVNVQSSVAMQCFQPDADEHCTAVTDICALQSWARPSSWLLTSCSFSLLVTPSDSCQQLGFPPLWIPKFIVNTTLEFLQNIINLKLFFEEEINSSWQI